ncbi:MAG: NADH-quinone oxidoreductase subunit L [Candidatus Omnitrophota bacterium]|nr:NADH-quinone oxidoreductase subunit L [Candidatus Omnitrophota bacterium]
MVKFTHLIPVFPFIAFLINIFFGRKIKKVSALVSILFSTVSFLVSIFTFIGFLNGEGSYVVYRFLSFNNTALDFGVTVDALSCMMLLVVTCVGTLIQVYSIGYMEKDPRFSRFFAYLSLFMTSMLSLIIADNLLMFYMGWEGVGLCSYLLISFWFEKMSAARAGMKAFITTRIGDTGFFIGILLLYFITGSVYFKDLSALDTQNNLFYIAALLIFCGAIGKSAQFPLHTWLPDAMEGPTPVSALIHAATMVAAGVYLVARTYSLFMLNEASLAVVGVIGAITALMAASIATVTNDIKRVLAYSTISQLGLMMLGLGVGGYSAGTFHLMTHAFFKALLFLCAGSVIHGVQTQDLLKMGGLFKKMKATSITFVIAALAIAGVPPFSGFWSKDEILAEALNNGHPVLFSAALLTSLLTSFYMFRLIFLALFGRPRSELHAHESPKVMTIPLGILAFFSIFIGLLGSPFTHHAFQNFIAMPGLHHQEEIAVNYLAMGLSILVAFLGIALSYLFYIRNNKILAESVRAKFKPLYNLISNKYYFDEIYDFLFVKPALRLARISSGFDSGVVDRAVNLAASQTIVLSKIQAWFDRYIVDGLVNLVGIVFQVSSGALRRMQTGLIQNYLLVAFFGIILVIIFKLIGGN